MIAKITRGSSAAGLAAYLMGPGKATKHEVVLPGGRIHAGGVVVQATDPRSRIGDMTTGWGSRLDRLAKIRPDIANPIWHVSLNLAPTDRRLTDDEWADAAQVFMDQMGVERHAWVAVRHDDRGVHIALCRVAGDGEVWHNRQDFRRAQKARRAIELDFDLYVAPTQKPDQKSETEVELRQIQDNLRAAAMAAENGIHQVEAEGKNWQVRRLDDGRFSVWREGLNGVWTLLKKGLRTLSQAILRDRKSAEAAKVQQIGDAIAKDPLLTDPPAPPPIPGYGPGRGPGR
jgi:hypothetical protein